MRITGIVFGLLVVGGPVLLMAQDDLQRPNILFIIADDHAYEAVGCYGNETVETPNLDRLAKQGVTLTHVYNQGSWSGAVCVASRTMLNTGRFLWQAHRHRDRLKQEASEGRLWSQYLRQAGYQTYMTGKWHVATDPKRLFDVTAHVRGGMPRQTPQGYNRPLNGQPDPWSPADPARGGFWQGGRHWSEVVADDAIEFLDRASQQDTPFFMYLAFNAPHDPRQAPQSYVDKYPLDQVDVPDSFQPQYPHMETIGCGKKLRDERLAPFPRTRHAVQVHRQEYFAIISHMDAQIGRILEALRSSDQADNTYVFFTADHGLAVGHHGLMGKQNMYEHSVRVPMIVTGPGLEPGRRAAAPVYLQDAMPTVLELAGVERPPHVQFHSLGALLRGETRRSPYAAIYGAYLGLQRMVTEGDYKLILYPKAGTVRLYHLRDDPQELHDLADQPEYLPTIKRLCRRLARLQQETGDSLQLSESFPRLFEASSTNGN